MSQSKSAKDPNASNKAVADRTKGSNSASGKRRDVAPTLKPLTKKARLITLLGTKGGVAIAEISEKLGWQQHTTRAALTGLRKAGFDVSSSKPSGGGAGRYSIADTPKAATATKGTKVSKKPVPSK